MIPCDLSEYDNLVQQAGQQSYPYLFATDTSQSPPTFWSGRQPPALISASSVLSTLMPDIATPETSSSCRGFRNTRYLRTRLAGELMGITDDTRCEEFLGWKRQISLSIISRWKDDKHDRAQTVKLDRRRVQNRSFSTLRNTKTIGSFNPIVDIVRPSCLLVIAHSILSPLAWCEPWACADLSL